MKLTIMTSLLQSMVAKSMKGASENKMIPITGLMAIELKYGKLSLITTDASNYLYVFEDKVEGDDFYVVVQAEIFSKLISRLTCEHVTLELDSTSLKVIGNGSYSIELPLDEEGQPIKFPNPLEKFTMDNKVAEINLSTIKLILNTAKASLSTSLDVPCYTGYYVGNNIVTTDTYKICGINTKLWDEPALISSDMMALLDVMVDEKIRVYRVADTISFVTGNCCVYGKVMDNIEDYQIDVIGGLLNEEFYSSCKLHKSALLQLLDRLSLFVGIYDKNGIYLTFTRDGLMITSKQANSSELIKYSGSENFNEYTCCIDIEMLRSQIKANASEVIELQYGKDNAIKITDGNVTQIIALIEDDRVAE